MMAVSENALNMPISRACYLIGIPRRSYYAGKPVQIRIVSSRVSYHTVKRIREICKERVTFGYRMVWAVPGNEGIHLNSKTVYRIMKDENLSLDPFFT